MAIVITDATGELGDKIVAVIKECYDPEIPVDIYELGLIYTIDIDADKMVRVTMTLTSPMCPVAESLPPDVERLINEVEEVTGVSVEVTWDPPWNPDMMSDAAKLTLGMF